MLVYIFEFFPLMFIRSSSDQTEMKWKMKGLKHTLNNNIDDYLIDKISQLDYPQWKNNLVQR